MTASTSTPSPAEVFGRPRIFDRLARPGSLAHGAAIALDNACAAAEDVAAALLQLRRDGTERYVDLHIARLRRAEARLDHVLDVLDAALEGSPIPAPSPSDLPPLANARRPAGP